MNEGENSQLNLAETDFGLVWGGITVFDSAIFALTVYKTVTLWRQGGRGLVHVVMRDGEFFFSI
jgi:hypothetical protein